MRRTLGVVAIVVGLGCSNLTAETAKAPQDSADPPPGSGYEGSACLVSASIPDGDLNGLLLGPVRVPSNGQTLHGVILRLEIRHPRTADLRLALCYDLQNDGVFEASVPLESYRARVGRWTEAANHACPQALDGVYFFRQGPEDLAAHDEDEVSLSVLEGLPAGGVFYLAVADTLARDCGTIRGWGVFVRKETL